MGAETTPDLASVIHSNAQPIVEALLGQPDKEEGGHLYWRCPYRNDEHPSLRITPKKGWAFWYDDAKKRGGDIIGLAALTWDLDKKKDFVEICTKLLEKAGLEVPETNGNGNGHAPKKKKVPVALKPWDGDREGFAAQYGLTWQD